MSEGENVKDFQAERRRRSAGGGQSADEIQPLELIDPLRWQDMPVPPRRWLVRDWIPEGHVVGLYGDGGVGKSLLAMQLATACAVGGRWLGLETKPCRALGIYCEDYEDELHRRQADINKLYDVEMGDLENLQLISRVGLDNLMLTFETSGAGLITPFWGQVRQASLDFGAELVIVDTAADTFGGNEIIRSQVRQFVGACLGRLAREIHGTVLLNAHPSASGMSSGEGSGGSTAWNNTLRARMFLHRPKPETDEEETDPHERILSRRKANYAGAGDGDEIRLRWSHGAFVHIEEPGGVFGTIAKRNAESTFLEALDALDRRGIKVSHKPSSANFAPKQMMGMKQTNGFRRRDLENAMKRLFDADAIRVERYGPPSRECEHIVRAANEAN